MNKPARQNIKPFQNEQDKTNALPRSPVQKATQKRRIKGRKLFLYGFIAWAAYVFFFVQIPELHRLNQGQQDVAKQMQEATQTQKDLNKKIAQLQDPAYIGQIARKQYMMVKDGETLFVEPK